MSNEPQDETILNEFFPLLSPALKSFYQSHNVTRLLSESSIRFIRLNPRYNEKETLAMLPESSKKVPWLDNIFGFYSVDGNLQLNQSIFFRSGRVYGMDASSGAAVATLLSDFYDKGSSNNHKKNRRKYVDLKGKRVLDLCCAPGLKLCMIADLLDESSLVVGVDASSDRLSLCKKIIKKYHIDSDTSGDDKKRQAAQIRLYCADGVTFGNSNTFYSDISFDSKVAQQDAEIAGKRKRMNKSARARERKRLKMIAEHEKKVSDNEKAERKIEPFDYVLVDAECSTDGSLKHLQQQLKRKASNVRMSSNGEDEERNLSVVDNQQLTNLKDLEELVLLQKSLLISGFSLLKTGGFLVYSTCSLSEEQNERVISALLDEREDAFLVPIEFPTEESFIKNGSISGTKRFIPNDHSKCIGGFFLAKIGKRNESELSHRRSSA